MKLVVDANVVFSALIKDSLTAELLTKLDLELHAPESLIWEFNKYHAYLLRKTSRNSNEFYKILKILMQLINVAGNKNLINFLTKAQEISPDFGDIDYFALALKLDCPIWSNDRRLKSQNIINVYSTQELLKIID